LGEKVWSLLNVEFLADGQTQCFPCNADRVENDSFVQSRWLRHLKVLTKSCVLGADQMRFGAYDSR